MKLKKGDKVKIVTGKDKGKEGAIEKVFPNSNKVLIPGMNQYKKHVKARTQNEKSEIITLTKPLPATNVALLCPKCKKQTRVGYKMEGTEKVRVCKKCNAQL